MFYGISLRSFKVFILLSLLFNWELQASELKLSKEEINYINQHPVIKVHVEKAWPPFNFIEGNEIKGFSNDLIRLVANNVGLKLEFVMGYHWSDYLTMLKTGEIDVITNMMITPEREKYAIFTQHHPIETVDGVLTLEGSSRYANLKFLKNKNLAVVRGFYYEDLIRTHFPNINLLLTNSTEESIEQLIMGNVDAVLDSYGVINFYLQRYFITGVTNAALLENKVFHHSFEFMGVNKNNPVLRSILDKGLQKISDEQLQTLKQQWLLPEKKSGSLSAPQVKPVIPSFTADEQKYLQQKKSLKMCVDPDWLPIEGIVNGQYTGMGSDFVRLFKQRISQTIELVKTDNWSQTLYYMQQGLCDFVPMAGRTAHLDNFLAFTYPYLRFPLVLVVKDEHFVRKLEDVLDKPIGIAKDNAYTEDLKKYYPNIELREYTTIKEGIFAVKKGDIYSFIGLLPVMSAQIQDHYPKLNIVDKLDYQQAISLATSLDDPMLLSIFNKVIATISVQQQEEIVNRRLPLIDDADENIDWQSIIFGLFAIVIIMLLLRLRTLHQKNTKLCTKQMQLEELSMRDFLTELPNKKYFLEQLDKEWRRNCRSQSLTSVVIVDIDNFKAFNQLYGRLAGDSCLVELSRRLQVSLKRPADMLARYDGDEFALILPETNEAGVKVVVTDLFYLLRQWGLVHTGSADGKFLTVSIGSATMQYNTKYTGQELFRRANHALYQSQQQGYNQLVQYQKKIL